MKNTKIISNDTAIVAILLCTILTFTLCSNRDENSTIDKSQSPVSKTTTKSPGIDIHTAVVLGDIEAIQQHIQAGSDLNVKEPAGGSSPLITATVLGKTEIAEALIKAGADVNYQNYQGSTALISAAFFCRTEIIEALLDNGADKTLRNNYGHTALESISAPFDQVKGIYDQVGKDLGPLGLKLDYDHIERTRPRIVEMLER